MPISPHKNGLPYTWARWMHYWNGLFALVISRNLALALFISLLSSWILSPNLPWGRNIWPLPRLNRTRRMHRHQRLSLGGWHVLRWIGLLEVATKLNSTSFLGKLDQFFFDIGRWWWLEVTPFFAYSAKEGRKWITKQIARKKPTLHKWRNEMPPSTSPMWNIIWHKATAQK